ncbi:hypothetical protein HHL17_15170 [Chitinophaga sp. G-6-1-13]|uniref:Uncharacterized protein n=1 Tax=Chitinophaga fulva TaxID=2728842 RepID=A0A848GME8_9BACT|nr:hypothetical protein [Chitinophaga fulva]NML38549.1 hypothetical protein [Chitinophaga fulva]
MELQNLDIDNYVNWYKDLSYKVEFATANEWRINRYMHTGWSLYARYVRNNENIKSKELSEWLSSEAKSLYYNVQEVKKYMESDDLPRIWYVPPVSAWFHFDDVVEGFTDTPMASITDRLRSGALPPIKIFREELERINQKEWIFTNNVQISYPFYISDIENEGEGWVTQFALFVRDCQFAKLLASRIEELEGPASGNTIRLPWQGTAEDLSELIKALSLTALKGVQETEIITVLGNVFNINDMPFNDEWYQVNINELLDKEPKNMFTAQLHQAINNFWMNDKNR